MNTNEQMVREDHFSPDEVAAIKSCDDQRVRDFYREYVRAEAMGDTARAGMMATMIKDRCDMLGITEAPQAAEEPCEACGPTYESWEAKMRKAGARHFDEDTAQSMVRAFKVVEGTDTLLGEYDKALGDEVFETKKELYTLYTTEGDATDKDLWTEKVTAEGATAIKTIGDVKIAYIGESRIGHFTSVKKERKIKSFGQMLSESATKEPLSEPLRFPTAEIGATNVVDILRLSGMRVDEEWANAPDEKVADAETQLNTMSGGPNRPKKQVNPNNPGDNPLAMKKPAKAGVINADEEEIAESLSQEFLSFDPLVESTDEVDEGFGKSIRRAAQGWGARDMPMTGDRNKPKDVVDRVRGQDSDTLNKLRGTDEPIGHSPRALQQRAIDRELRKRTKGEAVEEASDNSPGSKGFMAGYKGASAERNPYDAGTQEYKEWQNAWEDGREEMRDKSGRRRYQTSESDLSKYADKIVTENVEYEGDIGDQIQITGHVEFKGETGIIADFGQDRRFVIVNLYKHGKHSFHASDVSLYDGDEDDDEYHDADGRRNPNGAYDAAGHYDMERDVREAAEEQWWKVTWFCERNDEETAKDSEVRASSAAEAVEKAKKSAGKGNNYDFEAKKMAAPNLDEGEDSKQYTGRETKDGVWRVFEKGNSVAVAGPFDSSKEATKWIKDKSTVTESVNDLRKLSGLL